MPRHEPVIHQCQDCGAHWEADMFPDAGAWFYVHDDEAYCPKVDCGGEGGVPDGMPAPKPTPIMAVVCIEDAARREGFKSGAVFGATFGLLLGLLVGLI